MFPCDFLVDDHHLRDRLIGKRSRLDTAWRMPCWGDFRFQTIVYGRACSANESSHVYRAEHTNLRNIRFVMCFL